MMQRTLLLAALVVLLVHASSFGKEPKLRIRHIGVGHGDCTLIIATDRDKSNNWRSYSVLIDVGEPRADRTPQILETVISEIAAHAEPGSQLNYVVVSHYHFDHMGGMKDFLELLATDGRTSGWAPNITVIDRLGYGQTKGVDALRSLWYHGASYKDPSGIWQPTANGALNKYLKGAPYKNKRDPAWLGFNLFGWPYVTDTLRNIRMHCVTANGCLDWKDPYQKAASPRKKGKKQVARSENDLSFSFLLQLDGFRYFTGGDLGGENGRYTNIETAVVEFFRDKLKIKQDELHFCAWKVNHHGSKHSVNVDFSQYFQPTISVFPAFLRVYGKKPLPRDEVINRLLGYKEPIGGVEKTLIAQPVYLTFTFTTASDAHPATEPYILTKARYSAASTLEYSKRTPDKCRDVILDVARPAENTALFNNGATKRTIDITVSEQIRRSDNCVLEGPVVSKTLQCTRSHIRHTVLGYPNP